MWGSHEGSATHRKSARVTFDHAGAVLHAAFVRAFAFTLLTVLAATPALAGPAPRRPAVMVLYFDNQTNHPEYDVLKKGLADMMVTDLVASDVVDVVEREKLDAVLGELALQHTKAFDRPTAQKLGKLVGATHAVSGVILDVKDTLRLEVRVIELGTGMSRASARVEGPRDDLFVLQEKLAALLLDAMNVKLGTAPPVKSARDVDTLLSYSQAVDAADHGDFVGASARIAELLQRAPTFELGQDFKLALQKRMAAAGSARAQGQEQTRAALERHAADVLASAAAPIVSMADLQAARHLTYRVVHAQCLALGLESVLTPRPVRNVPRGGTERVLRFADAYVQDLLALEAELAAWRGPFRWLPDPGDRAALQALGLDAPDTSWLQNLPGVPRRAIGAALLTGRFELGGVGFAMRPTPAELDARRLDDGVKALDQAAGLLARAPAKFAPQELVAETLFWKVQGLLLAGRRQDAAKLAQSLLERFPQSRLYADIEARLKDALDLSPDALGRAEAERALAKAVSSCDAQKVPAALDAVLATRFAEAGLWGVTPLVDEVEKACGRRPAFAKGLGQTLALAAGYAERHGDCVLFDEYLGRLGAVAAGDVAAVRAQHPGCAR